MKTGIQRERFSRLQYVGANRRGRHEDQIPTTVGNRARNDHEFVLSEECIAESLLTGARDSRPEPIGIWDRCRIDDMAGGGLGNRRRGQNMRHGIQRVEALVDRDLQNRRRGVDRTIDRADPSAVPTAAYAVGAFATIPGRPELNQVKAPCHKFRAAK